MVIIKNSLVVFLIPSVHGWKLILARWKGLNEKLKFEVNLPREIKDFYSEEEKIRNLNYMILIIYEIIGNN